MARDVQEPIDLSSIEKYLNNINIHKNSHANILKKYFPLCFPLAYRAFIFALSNY
jgi:hypothetical protein